MTTIRQTFVEASRECKSICGSSSLAPRGRGTRPHVLRRLKELLTIFFKFQIVPTEVSNSGNLQSSVISRR